jgi:hypothetical protein
MVLVFVSHFGMMYFLPARALAAARVASYIGLPSSPIFVLFSGMMLGMMARERVGSFDSLRIKLVDRGLFLLLPADVIIRAAHHWVELGLGPGTRWVFVTDAIGASMVVVPWVITRTTRRARAAAAAILLSASWLLFFFWEPSGRAGDLTKAVLVGEAGQKGAVFALVPWVGGYIAATIAGEALADWRRAGQPIVARLLAMAGLCAAPSVVMHLVRRDCGPHVAELLSIGQKYPPSPAFFMAWASAGWVILAASAWFEEIGGIPVIFPSLALLGRSSLVVFVSQYLVYYVGFFLLRLPMSPLWPLYFAGSVLINLGVAWLWDTYAGNQYLTVGLTRLVASRRARLAAFGVANAPTQTGTGS